MFKCPICEHKEAEAYMTTQALVTYPYPKFKGNRKQRSVAKFIFNKHKRTKLMVVRVPISQIQGRWIR